MKQHQSPKETPRTLDKVKTFAVRCSKPFHKRMHAAHRGSEWARKVLEAAADAEDKK